MGLVLIGFKGCGKTSVAKACATDFVDLDSLIIKQHQSIKNEVLTCSEIYRTYGAQYFLNLEKNIIQQLPYVRDRIIATGGGSVMDLENVECLRRHGKFIYLHASHDVLFARLQTVPAFLNVENLYEEFLQLYNQRETIYRKIANRIILTDHKSIIELACELSEVE